MVGIPKSVLTTTILVVALLMPQGQAAGQEMHLASSSVSGRTGTVYVIRGLMNVFSRGMDTLAGELRGRGFRARVVNHARWSAVAAEITQRYESAQDPEPVFLIGHSLGADAVILVAELLKKNEIPVSLAVTFDPVHPRPIPGNVRRVLNFFQSNNGFGAPVRPEPGVRVSVVNTDLKDRGDIAHGNIDKATFLHEQVVDEMMRLSRPVRRRTAG